MPSVWLLPAKRDTLTSAKVVLDSQPTIAPFRRAPASECRDGKRREQSPLSLCANDLSMASDDHLPDSFKRVLAMALKPCAVISSPVKLKRRRAAFTVFSDIGFDGVLMEGNTYLPSPVSALADCSRAIACVESGTMCSTRPFILAAGDAPHGTFEVNIQPLCSSQLAGPYEYIGGKL